MPGPRVDTLLNLLELRANDAGNKVAFTFNRLPTTYAEMWQGTNRFARLLHDHELRSREPVLVLLPNSKEFFFAFYGIQRAGGIAVPLFPGSSMERVAGIAQHCRARIAVVPSENKGRLNTSPLQMVSVDDAPSVNSLPRFPIPKPTDVAFIQFTSGSTGNPKGVMLTHANLLTNIQQMIEGMEITENDVFVSWLPVYHDMGLILKTMVPFFLTAETHILSTDLTNIRTWLKTIEILQATFTAAPDFAYRMAVRFTEELVNLSSLRVALNAAEPVRASTIRDFESKFGLHKVMTAGYGLAEATVGVSMSRPGTPPRVDKRGLVSVGKPFTGVEIRIAEDKSVPEFGEIAIRSEANSQGYFNNLEETTRLYWRDGFLLSGDLGYLDKDGFLYITGRKKNVIKHAGETVAAQEIEETIDAVHEIRFSAAVGIDRGGLEGEQVVIFAEVRGGDSRTWENTHIAIVEAVYARLGIRPGEVYLLKPRAIPRTYNGKLQHTRLREQFLSGELQKKKLILYPDSL